MLRNSVLFNPNTIVDQFRDNRRDHVTSRAINEIVESSLHHFSVNDRKLSCNEFCAQQVKRPSGMIRDVIQNHYSTSEVRKNFIWFTPNTSVDPLYDHESYCEASNVIRELAELSLYNFTISDQRLSCDICRIQQAVGLPYRRVSYLNNDTFIFCNRCGLRFRKIAEQLASQTKTQGDEQTLPWLIFLDTLLKTPRNVGPVNRKWKNNSKKISPSHLIFAIKNPHFLDSAEME